MKKTFIAIAAAGFGFAAIQGCAVEQGASYETEDVGVSESALAGTGSMTITSDWGSGFCADVKIRNGLPESTSKWQVILDMKSTRITSTWNSSLQNGATGIVTAKPVSYNTQIPPNGEVSFGFCASASSSARPVMKAWNMATTVYSDCGNNGGVNPTKAAVAVAAATELGTWDPLAHFTVVNNMVGLTSAAQNICNNAAHQCRNLKGLLDLQRDGATSDQNVFNPTTFRNEMLASFDRHRNNINNLNNNNRSKLPIAHKLSLVSGPTNIGQVQNGVSKSCGPHYIYKVTRADGSNPTSTEAANLVNALYFYGEPDNPYIGFTSSGLSACPSGSYCVAIDPTDGDNSSTSTTTAGSAPMYPLNRVLDSIPTMLGSPCITTLGKFGTLQTRTGSSYLHCTPI